MYLRRVGLSADSLHATLMLSMLSINPSQCCGPRATRRSLPAGSWQELGRMPETITVPELHRVLQTAFGWENRHLFGIGCVDRLGQPRVIIGPDDAAEEMGDEPASGVVLGGRRRDLRLRAPH